MADDRSIEDQARDDVRLVVGGDFSIDSVGPERFAATVARVRELPALHLDVFDQLVAATAPETLIELRPATLLDLLRDLAPDRVRDSARNLLARLESAPAERALAAAPAADEVDLEEADRARARAAQRRHELLHLAEEP